MNNKKLSQNAYHITQSFQWGEFRKKTGVKVIRFNNLTFYLHRIPHLPFFVGYLPRPAELDEKILNELLKIGKKNNCIFIKVEPELNQLINKSINYPINKSKSVLPRHTFFIDLTKSEEELLKNMHEKTRYNIRLSLKHGIIVKQGETKEDLENFIKILESTERRQGFSSHPANYYRILWQTLRPAGMVYLLLAYPPLENQIISKSNDQKSNPSNHQVLKSSIHPVIRLSSHPIVQPIASIMLFKFKDTLYYPYGGSLPQFRNLMPNHLLHWEAIKLGKKLGCKIYDMWGAYRYKPESSDPWWGIYRFKSGFGGKLVTYPESFDLIISPFFYKIFSLFDFIRWQIIKIKRLF